MCSESLTIQVRLRKSGTRPTLKYLINMFSIKDVEIRTPQRVCCW